MKTILIFISIIAIVFCGHIYVEEPQLKWQNKGELSQIQLRFSLESGLGVGDYLVVTYPVTWQSCGTGSKLQQGSTDVSVYSPTSSSFSCAVVTQEGRYQFGVALSANTWYSLTLSSASISVDEKLYEQPIKMQTRSSIGTGGIVYDENGSCGQIAISEEVTTLKGLQVSQSPSKVAVPSSVDANKVLEASYSIYIDIQTTKDYQGGAMIRYSITKPFIFTGTCSSVANTCVPSGVTGYDSTCVNTTLDSGTCVSETGGTGNYIHEHISPLSSKLWYRVKIDVKNPSFYQTATYPSNTGTINVYLYSRAKSVYYYYEKYTTLSTQFEVSQLGIADKVILYFWGLATQDKTMYCPITLYRDSDVSANTDGITNVLKIWNKVQIYWQSKNAFPTLATATYRMVVNINQVNAVALGSVNTNLARKDSSKKLNCQLGGTDAASRTIICDGLAAPSVAVYWTTASVNFAATATTSANFGKIQIYCAEILYDTAGVQQTLTDNSYKEVATGSSGTSITPRQNDEFINGYSTDTTINARLGVGPQVFNFPYASGDYSTRLIIGDQIKKILITGTDPDSTGNVALTSTSATAVQNLIFLIDPTIDQLCCKSQSKALSGTGTSTSHNCAEAVASCDLVASSGTATSKALLMLRLIANSNILDFSEDAFKNAGVHPVSTGLFGQITDGDQGPCARALGCGTYSTTTPADNLKTAQEDITSPKIKWYNLWIINKQSAVSEIQPEEYAILALTCADVRASKADQNPVCPVANKAAYAASSSSAFYPALVWNNVKFKSTFLGNPLYPSKSEFDFILCFRYKANNGLTQSTFNVGVTEESLASSGVLHAQAYWSGYSASTVFKINVFNVLKVNTNFNDFSVAPILLRFGGNLAQADWIQNNGVALFFDSGVTLDNSASATRSISSAYYGLCASATASSISCEEYNSQDANTNYFYYPIMRRLVMKVTIDSANDFNHYAPLQATDQLMGISAALVNTDSTGSNYVVQRAYKLFGYQQGPLVNLYYSATGVIASLPSSITNDAAGLRALGVIPTAQINSCAPAYTFNLNAASTKAYGGYTAPSSTPLKISSKIQSCATTIIAENAIASGETGTDGKNRVYNGKWGTHFTVAATQVKFWEGSKLTWDYKHDTSPKNDCFEFNYKSSSASDTRLRYIIVCPADQATTAIGINGQDKYLSFDKFAIPFYFGKATTGFNFALGYVWSDTTGIIQGYLPQSGQSYSMGQETSNTGDACTATAYTSTYLKSGIAQKVTFVTKLTQTIVLDSSLTNFRVEQTLSQNPPAQTATIGSYCISSGSSKCAATLGQTSQFTITSTKASTTSDSYTGDFSISYWASTGSTADITTTYTVKVYALNTVNFGTSSPAASTQLEVNTCQSTGSAWQAGTSDYGATVTNVKLTFDTVKKQQGSFSVTWTINKSLWSFSAFRLTLGIVGPANTNVQTTNLKCNLMNGGSYDFDFLTSTSDVAVDSAVSLTLKDQQSNGYEYKSKTSFTFKCVGALAPVNDIKTTDNVLVEWLAVPAGAVINKEYDVGTDSTTTLAKARTPEVLTSPALDSNTSYSFATTVTKTWSDLGNEAVYTFTTIITAPTSFDAGIWFIFEFTRAIAPRLNNKGALYCEQGYNTTLTSTYCKFDGERRIKLLSNQKLYNTTVNPTGYKFVIYGVAQPAAFINSYDQIYWALLDKSGAIQKQDWLKDPAIGTTAPVFIKLLDYSVSTNYTRSTATFIFDIALASSTVKADQELYIQFNGEFENAFYKGFTPSCKLNRWNDDWSGQGGDDFSQNCTYVKGRKIKAFLKVDSVNSAAAKAYRLTVAGVPTPLDADSGLSLPTILIPVQGGTTASKRTAPGQYNITYYGFGDEAAKTYVAWQDAEVQAKIGVYSGSATLIPGGSKKAFLEDILFTTTSSAFSYNPTTFQILGGMKSFPFIFAPKSTTSAGLQFIEFATTLTNYAPMKPLRVVVLADQCQVTNDGSYDFPVGGTSLPYVINFQSCQPETSVILKLYAHNKTSTSLADINKQFDSKNFTIDSDGTSKQFEVKFGGVQAITFSLKSTDQTVAIESGVGKLLFNWESSPNQNSYSISNTIATVNSVKAETVAATTTLSSAPAAGSVTLSFTCDQAAVFYFAVATSNNSLSSLTYQNIKAKSLDLGVSQSWPDFNNNDIIYGYTISKIASTPSSVTVSRVKSRKKYFAVGMCINTAGLTNTTTTKYTNWTQTDNGGRPAITNITYSVPLTLTVHKTCCSAFAIATSMPCNRTLCPTGSDACSGSTTLAFGGSTTTSTTTTTTTNTTNTTNATNSTRRVRMLQNTTCNITQCTTCLNATICSVCNTSYVVALDGLSCITSCPTGQTNMSGKCQIYSTKTSYYYTTLPDEFIATDTTYTDILAALTDIATFNSIFKSKAGLGNITYDTPVLLPQITTLGTSVSISSANITEITESSAKFMATINQTDGFIFYATAAGSISTTYSITQIKSGDAGNGTQFVNFFYPFVKNGQSVSIPFSNLTSGSPYTGFWFATNQDPINGTTTDSAYSQTFNTLGTNPNTNGTTTYGSNISLGFFAILALLFALFVLI